MNFRETFGTALDGCFRIDIIFYLFLIGHFHFRKMLLTKVWSYLCKTLLTLKCQPHKMVKHTMVKQTNCLSVFHNFLGLALKRSKNENNQSERDGRFRKHSDNNITQAEASFLRCSRQQLFKNLAEDSSNKNVRFPPNTFSKFQEKLFFRTTGYHHLDSVIRHSNPHNCFHHHTLESD